MTTPFGTAMRSRGLTAYDDASVRTALDALEAEHKDSDGDGTPDIAELRAGTNPNAAAGEEVVVPDYGCTIAGGRACPSGLQTTYWLMGAAVAIRLLRRRIHQGSSRESPRLIGRPFLD